MNYNINQTISYSILQDILSQVFDVIQSIVLTSLCSWFEPCLVRNPEDRFSHITALVIPLYLDSMVHMRLLMVDRQWMPLWISLVDSQRDMRLSTKIQTCTDRYLEPQKQMHLLLAQER